MTYRSEMITLCTVVITSIERHVEILIDSILSNTTLVKEVLIATTDREGVDVSWEHRGIKFRKFSVPTFCNFGHPLGLHGCLERATNDYILFMDPDTFWFKDGDKVLMDNLHKYDVKVVGVSHHAAVIQAFHFFPVIFCMLIRRQDLPPKTWKEGLWRYREATIDQLVGDDTGPREENRFLDGKFLLRGPLPGYYQLYPNQDRDAIYDEGTALWLWFQENGWRWLAFQTLDCHNYTTSYYKSNFRLLDKPTPKQKLLFHGIGSTNAREWEWLKYKKAYLEAKGSGQSLYSGDGELRAICRHDDRLVDNITLGRGQPERVG
jgi:hypothetical protein